jgi:hypothetical protein
MSSISKTEALIYLAAYQNQGTLVDYLDPWIAIWTNDFILTGLSNQLHLKILEAGFDEDELEDVVQNQPDIHDSSFGIERELLKEWTEWIISDNKRKDIVKAELEGYFYWHGKPWWEIPGDDDIPWYTEEGMPDTPQEALEWFKEIFGKVESN